MGNLPDLADRRRLPPDERRASIARAAGPLFARHGYAATRLEEVAAAAGVTKPIVYRHFASKKVLYLALLRKHRDDLPTFAEGLEPPDEPAARAETLRALVSGWLDYVRENNHAWWMIFRDSSGDAEIRAFRTEVNLRAREVMADLIARFSRGGIPREQIDPTAELLTSGLAGMALWWGDHPETQKKLLVEVAVRITEPALATRPR